MPDAISMPDTAPTLSRSLANLRPFDHARALQAAAASVASRRKRAAERRQADLAAHVQRVAEPDERLVLLAEQIARTRKALNQDDLQGKDRAALLRALCSLLDQQRIARGEPLPGSRRPKDVAPQVARPGAWIVDAEPMPVPAPISEAVRQPQDVVLPVAPSQPGTSPSPFLESKEGEAGPTKS
jgi:hypothetical protein